MSEIPTSTPQSAPEHSLHLTLDRLGGHMLAFAFVFAVVVWASVLFILPRYALVEVLGSKYPVAVLPAMKADLLAQVSAAEERRNLLVQPVQSDTYEALKQSRSAQAAMDALREVERVDRQVGGPEDAVHIAATAVDLEHHTISLTGDVRNVGMQSMTVLAEFLDALARIPSVATVSPVPFVRQTNPKFGTYSPFTVTVTLK